MGSVAKITMRQGERLESALKVLSELAAEGRLHSLLFVAQADDDDESMGTFGEYSDPESLVILTTRLHLRSQQALLRASTRRKPGIIKLYRKRLPADAAE